ncbi:unnamed protein product [Didymodactylos carnosus]|uniref:Laminin G domain-containing protein n=1 Tax=Didymodactylos carnosus TaxID=1234261 RepID=A0A813TL83_9BILA|nr:unnamed protein product [Didymodactylos carnosus]CAF0813326.1 unnamed protein product [Didymodactylos carnosus]CAF3553681.1 unnamed protein product [Didymodactylos carnosus]CAF3599207.1 unnamed protein product [Didymodactylos carnosus]
MESLFNSDESVNINYLNPIEGIQFDGTTFALYDPNFKIENNLNIAFQLQTFAQDGLIMWLGDPFPENSFTIEIQNKQLIARVVINGQPFSVRTEFVKNRLCDGLWHFITIRLDGNLLTMKVDKRNFMKTEPRVNDIQMRGPLFIAGYSAQYSPPYISVRTKDFFCGNLRNLKINNSPVDWLAPKNTLSSATPEFHSADRTSFNHLYQQQQQQQRPIISNSAIFDSTRANNNHNSSNDSKHYQTVTATMTTTTKKFSV